MVIEPVQGEGGFYQAPADFMQALRRLCDRHGILLICDEIQTGFARTGKMFASEHVDIEPDLMTMAKGIGGGVPVAAAAVTAEIAESVSLGDHGTTFGGGPVACAAVKATLETVEKERLAERAERVGRYLVEKLEALPRVKEVRGLGLLVGFIADKPAREIQEELFGKGVLVGTSVDPRVVRLLPPLTIGQQEVDKLISALGDS